MLGDLNCRDNIALPLRLTGFRRQEARKKALALMSELDIEDLAARNIWELSGGQRQRAAVARALVTNPPVILADEPTGALDRKNADATVSLLLQAAERRSSTVILVTHDPQTAERCDHLVTVEDGQIVERQR